MCVSELEITRKFFRKRFHNLFIYHIREKKMAANVALLQFLHHVCASAMKCIGPADIVSPSSNNHLSLPLPPLPLLCSHTTLHTNRTPVGYQISIYASSLSHTACSAPAPPSLTSYHSCGTTSTR